jgi:hypothetical protein
MHNMQLIINIIGFVYLFVLGAVEGYNSNNGVLAGECIDIKIYYDITVCFNIVVPFCALLSFLYCHEVIMRNKNILLILLFIEQFICIILAYGINLNMNDACNNFLTTHKPQILTFIMIQYVMAWISIACSCFLIIYIIIKFNKYYIHKGYEEFRANNRELQTVIS